MKMAEILLLIAVLLLVPAAEAASQKEENPEYSVTLIVKRGTNTARGSCAINNSCQIVEFKAVFLNKTVYLPPHLSFNERLEGFTYRGNRWQKGNIQVLDVPNPKEPTCFFSAGSSLNNLGQIVGSKVCKHKKGGRHRRLVAVFWDGKNDLQELGTFSGWRLTSASDINDKGQIVGTARKGDSFRPYLWERGDIFLVDVSEESFSRGYYGRLINNRGEIIIGGFYGYKKRSFIWRKGGKLRNLGTLGGDLRGSLDINDQGQVVGSSDLEASEAKKKKEDLEKEEPYLQLRIFKSVHHGFLWEDGEMKDIGALPGYLMSRANAINNQGQIVGLSTNCKVGRDYWNIVYEHTRAVLWQEGRIFNLNSLIPSDSGWLLVSARDINDSGQILAVGVPKKGENSGGSAHLLLLEPIRHSSSFVSLKEEE